LIWFALPQILVKLAHSQQGRTARVLLKCFPGKHQNLLIFESVKKCRLVALKSQCLTAVSEEKNRQPHFSKFFFKEKTQIEWFLNQF
jgi:hypothetical protein